MGQGKITNYSGYSVGTAIDYPEHPNAMTPCQGRVVRLGKAIGYGRLDKLDDARVVADNMVSGGRAIAILREDDDDGRIFFSVYELEGDLGTDYSAAGITFSNMQRAGQNLPKNVSIVELYDEDRNVYELSVLDTETPHPYPEEGDHYYCSAPSNRSLATRAAGSFSEWFFRGNDIPIGRRLHYVYHTSPVTEDSSGRIRSIGSSHPSIKMDRESVGKRFEVLVWMLDEAKKDPSKIFNLEYQTLALAGKETRAELIERLLCAKDLSDEEKAIGCLGLFKTIPQDIATGRDAKKEAAWIFEYLKRKNLLGKLLTTTPADMRLALMITLDDLGAPDGLFKGVYDNSDVALAEGQGNLVGTVDFSNGIAEMVTDPISLMVVGFDLIQTAGDRLAIAAVGADNLIEDVSQRVEGTDAAIMAALEYYDDALKAADRLGAGPLIKANMVGKFVPDAAFLLLCLSGPVMKASKYAKDLGALSKAELTGAVSAELAGYSPHARKFILMLAGL